MQHVNGGWGNGGIAVFETGRAYGGDSAYYYVGTYFVSGNRVTGELRIVHYNGDPATVWGDASTNFKIKMEGTYDDNTIVGTSSRPRRSLGFKATKKEPLP